MRRGSIFFLIIMLGFSILTGCQQQEEPKELEMYSKTEVLGLQIKEEGIYFIDGYTMLMMFYDYKLDQKIPLCDKPNCTHDSNECNAFVMYGAQSGMGCYRDKIYFFDITDAKFPLYQADKNGTNRKVLTTLGDKFELLSVWKPFFFVGDYIYFQINFSEFLDEPVVREDGEIESMKNLQQFARIHLKTGVFETIMEAKDYSEYQILDCTERELLYSDKQKIFCYDLETKQSEKIVDGYMQYERETKEIYYNTADEETESVHTLNLETREERFVFQTEKNGMGVEWRLVGDDLYYSKYFYGESETSGEMGVYNITKQTEKKLTKEQYLHSPQYETSAWYITYSEEGLICISKEAYENQEWDKVQVIGRI